MKLLALTVLLLSFSQVHASEMIEHSQGIAKNEKGEVMYREKHKTWKKEGKLKRLETEYFDPNTGKKFGAIETDYAVNPYVPVYDFNDLRNHRFVSVKTGEKNVQVRTKIGKDSEKAKNEFPLYANMVAGQGLHNFIRERLELFQKNSEHRETVKFLIPLNDDYYTFRIKVKEQSEKNITVRIEADSWFFRMLAPHIDVTYEKGTRRLMRYEGPSNLLSQSGDKMNVTIDYKYDKEKS